MARKVSSMGSKVSPTGKEVFFDHDDIIVSKTDLKGRITYANQTFLDVAGYTSRELQGQPHSIIRHPDMPRCVFKLLWDQLALKKEVFAYVVNMAKNGDHYWVFAHVTPSYDDAGQVIGYHSNRRVPDPDVVKSNITPLYAELKAEEERHANRKKGMHSAFASLLDLLKGKNISYDEFIFSLQA
jgi:PAS domain S-box-containing protein